MREKLNQIGDCVYELPVSTREDMRVPVRIFMSEHMLDKVFSDRSLWQIMNVSTLPGIQKYAIAMADLHEGYGFPIGGVAAMAVDEGGVISPGGIGYDINCGVRLLGTNLDPSKRSLNQLHKAFFRPCLLASGVQAITHSRPSSLIKYSKRERAMW